MLRKKFTAFLCAFSILLSMFPSVSAADTQDIEIIDTSISFDEPEGLDELTNIALNRSVTSEPDCYNDHPASEITDGVYDTFAKDSSASFAQIGDVEDGDWYLTIDLGTVRRISTVVLRKFNTGDQCENNLLRYQIQISENGTDWKQLGTAESEPEPSKKDVYFTPSEVQSAKYVRLFAEDVASGWKTVDEIEVYSEEDGYEFGNFSDFTNLAYDSQVSMDEPSYNGHPAEHAVDGDLGTYAQASEGQPFSLTFKFSQPTQLNTFVVKESPRVKGFKVWASDNNKDWTLVSEFTKKESDDPSQLIAKFDPLTTSYLKMEITDCEEWMAVTETGIYDTSTVPAVTSSVKTDTELVYGNQVELNALEGAEIYYTNDGSDPKTSQTVQTYSGPIVIERDQVIKAYAKKEGMNDSPVSQYQYTIRKIETDPKSGMVQPGTVIKFINRLQNSDIYYTTDGSDPISSDTAIKYTDGIVINGFTTIYACCKDENGKAVSSTYRFFYDVKNAASGKVVTASSEAVGNEVGSLLDGDLNSLWRPASVSDNEWVMIDFGDYYDFEGVNIVWANAEAGSNYTIETSSDTYIWASYFSNKNNDVVNGEEQAISQVENHRRYMRIKLSKSGAENGIREIQIIGDKSADTPAIPMYDDESDIYDRVVVNPIPDYVNGVENNKISLNGEWNFSMTPQNGFWADSADLSDWDTAKVPGDLDAQGFPVYFPENPDWTGGYSDINWRNNTTEMAYKTKVFIPDDYEGQKVFLRVDKTFNFSRVWVNGQYVREHRGAWTTWDADITNYIKPGEENWITISVTTENCGEYGFWDLAGRAGIGGNVSIYATSSSYLNRLHTEVDLDENFEDAELTIMTNTFLAEGKEADVQLSLTDPEGNAVDLGTNSSIHVAANENFTDKNITVSIPNPKKWDPDHPNLYKLTAKVVVDGQTVETISKNVGFREITIDGSIFKVNGIAVKLRGVNMLNVYGNDGECYDFEVEKKFLETAKANNINYIRAAHFPRSTEFLDLCDQMGIFVEQENAVAFAGSAYSKQPTESDENFYLPNIAQNVSEMVEKDRSHPSIVIWSVANESQWGSNMEKLSQYIEDVCPSIPTKFSWGSQIPANSSVDIQSNHYGGDGVGRYGRPTVWDEYAHSYSSGNEGHLRFDPGFRENYYQIIKQNWEKIYNDPVSLGGAIWDFIDNAYEGENRLMGNSNWGQVDIWGRAKPEIWATKNVYSPVQYKGEDFVNLPEVHQNLELPYENRYDNVAFNDSDFEIWYCVNDEEPQKLSSDLMPKETGTISVPAPEEGWSLGDKITLEFYKTTAGVRRNVVTNQITIGEACYNPPEASGTAPEVTEDDTAIYVKGDNFQITFNKESGKIVNGSYGDETVLTGGPHLNLGMTDVGNWTLNNISQETTDEFAIITIDGSYSNSSIQGCKFVLTIDSQGQIETAYTLKNTNNVSDYEIGVAYDLSQNTDSISWVRDGYLNYYPEDQLGRLEGTAVKENEDGWVREWGVKPPEDKAWKDDDKDFYNFGRDDQGGRGTTDFRASKTGIYYAEMGLDNSNALLSIYGNGEGSVRSSINDDQTVRIHINNLWGYPVNGMSGISEKKVVAEPGYSNKILMQLSDINNNYNKTYAISPIYEQIPQDQMKATADSENRDTGTEGPAAYVLDANPQTIWHTDYENGSPACPHYIELDLGKSYTIGRLTYLPRTDSTSNGRIKDYEIQVMNNEGDEWIKVAEGKFPNNSNLQTVDFSPIDASKLRLVAVSSYGNPENTFASASELNVYTYSVNKFYLQSLYDQYKDLTNENYTQNSWDNFQAALTEAEKTLNDPQSTQSEVESAATGLENAVQALEKVPVDKSLLLDTYEYALTLNTEGVVESAVKLFNQAMDNAKAVLDDPEATQEEVKAAWDELLEGIWGLGITQGDKTQLELLIEKAEEMMNNADKYVETNWQELVDALAEAKEVMDNGDALEEDVKAAAEALNHAILIQRYKANKENLKDLVEKANKIDLSQYTTESANVLKAALENANQILSDESLSEDDQAVVDEAVEKLSTAIENLEKVSESSDKEDGDKDSSNSDKETEDSNNSETTDSPTTGDTGLYLEYVGLFVFSMIALGVLYWKKRKVV